jgi:hypothetical protein
MARPASIALAGYFPAPAHLLPSFASLVTFSLPQSRSPHVLVDPCAGEGEAIIGLRNLWFGEERSSQRHDAHLFLVELENGRFQAAEAQLSQHSSYGARWDTVLETTERRCSFSIRPTTRTRLKAGSSTGF